MLKRSLSVVIALTALSLTSQAQGRRGSDAYDEEREERRMRREERAQEEREDRIAEKEERKMKGIRDAASYGSNFLRIAPLRVLDIGGVGFGLEYERLIGQNKMVGVILPFSVLLEEQYNSWNSIDNNLRYNPYFYFCPGIKIYPFGQRKVTYAVGPSLMMGYGKTDEWTWVSNDPWGNSGYYVEQDRTRFNLGMMVMNYVNFQVTKNFSLGIDAGLGVRYLSHQKIGNNRSYNEGIQPTGQFSMTLGYRF